MEVVAEFTIDEEYKWSLFKLFREYERTLGFIDGFNEFVKDNPHNMVSECGFDVCWVLLFGDWKGSYIKSRHLLIKRGSRIKEEQWEIKKAQYGFRCFYCGAKNVKLTKDHVIPTSQGGDDTADNIVPACWKCNRRKRASPISVFKQGATLKLL